VETLNQDRLQGVDFRQQIAIDLVESQLWPDPVLASISTILA
jgi:hypothetical protein